MEFGSVKSVGDKIGEFRLGMRCGWWIFGACEEVGYETSTELDDVFVAVIWILLR